MSRQAVIISGIIGLLFGFLISGTLGVDFFPEEVNNNNNNNNDSGMVLDDLLKDEEAFRLAYNLDSSIYTPIYGNDVYDKIEDGETFIVYIGRDTCPYCQSFVPNLQEAAQNKSIVELFHVDSTDPSNQTFINMENFRYTPTTLFVKDGVVVETLVGHRSVEDVEDIITNKLM